MSQQVASIDRPNYIRTADGVDLFYRDWGSGDPVVFVGSWSLPSDSWSYQMMALTDAGLRCVAFDRRGHGRSSDPDGGYDFDTLADDLAAVLDVLDLRDVTLVGHSMGPGEIVRYLTRHGGERVARTVWIGAITPLLHQTEDNPDGIDPSYFEQFRTEQLMKDLPQWIEDNLHAFTLSEVSPHMHDWIRSLVLTASGRALIECNRSITTTDFREELRRIAIPTLLVHGDRDETCPIDITARPTVALMPNAELRVYEGAPHGLFLSHMDRFNADLLAFIRGC